MKKIVPLSLSLVALATLGACGGVQTTTAPVTAAPMATVVVPTVYYPRTGAVAFAPSAPGPVMQSTVSLRAGFGRVDSITSVVNPDGTWGGLHRLGLRMQDGSAQIVDTRSPYIQIGELVEITRDGLIRDSLASR